MTEFIFAYSIPFHNVIQNKSKRIMFIQMPFRFTQTMLLAGQWAHGMLTSESMRQAMIHNMNKQLVHTQDPFKDYGDDTHAYAVYKVLYDAVAEGLTEEDYTTTEGVVKG